MDTEPASFRERLSQIMTSPMMEHFIIAVIGFNAVVLGAETYVDNTSKIGQTLQLLDQFCLAVFVCEILIKFYAMRETYFEDRWHIFDVIVVGIALIPASGAFAVVRTLRIMRILRIITFLPRLRMVVESLLVSIPGMIGVMFLIMMIFYVYAVMGTSLYGEVFPEYFGTLTRSYFTLFQVMTLESWASGVARPVMMKFEHSWVYFFSFITITTISVLNLIVGLLVNSIQEQREKAKAHLIKAQAVRDKRERLKEQDPLLDAIASLKKEVKQVKKKVDEPPKKGK